MRGLVLHTDENRYMDRYMEGNGGENKGFNQDDKKGGISMEDREKKMA